MLQTIRSDNVKEYTNDVFDKFYEEVGIESKLIVPYILQQNSVSERKNRSIMEEPGVEMSTTKWKISWE